MPGVPKPLLHRSQSVLDPHWSDNKAELAGYKLETPRYGEQRTGHAVAIFVTETLAHDSRVKTNKPQDGSHYPVMKLNLTKDFQTGIYDYNTMLSAFVTLTHQTIIYLSVILPKRAFPARSGADTSTIN